MKIVPNLMKSTACK